MAIYVYGGGGGTGGGITNGAGNNVVMKSDGTNAVASSLTDDGTNVTQTTNHIFSADNTQDIGASGATRPRTIYVGTSVISPLFTISSTSGIVTSAGVNFVAAATAPAATTGASQAGKTVSITASAAVASTDTAGAAAGGDVTITAGAAARNTSGNADGGNINLVTGAGIGTGHAGQVLVPDGTGGAPGIARTAANTTGIAFPAGQLTIVHSGAGITRWSSTAHEPVTSNSISLGSSSQLFKNAFLTTSLQGGGTKALTETTATGFVSITTATNDRIGGFIRYVIEATDGTDLQARSGILAFAIVDKAGTAVCNLSTLGTEAFIETAGASTLTNTFDSSVTAHVTTIRANATSSLAQTALNIKYFVEVCNTTAVAQL